MPRTSHEKLTIVSKKNTPPPAQEKGSHTYTRAPWSAMGFTCCPRMAHRVTGVGSSFFHLKRRGFLHTANNRLSSSSRGSFPQRFNRPQPFVSLYPPVSCRFLQSLTRFFYLGLGHFRASLNFKKMIFPILPVAMFTIFVKLLAFKWVLLETYFFSSSLY